MHWYFRLTLYLQNDYLSMPWLRLVYGSNMESEELFHWSFLSDMHGPSLIMIYKLNFNMVCSVVEFYGIPLLFVPANVSPLNKQF